MPPKDCTLLACTPFFKSLGVTYVSWCHDVSREQGISEWKTVEKEFKKKGILRESNTRPSNIRPVHIAAAFRAGPKNCTFHCAYSKRGKKITLGCPYAKLQITSHAKNNSKPPALLQAHLKQHHMISEASLIGQLFQPPQSTLYFQC